MTGDDIKNIRIMFGFDITEMSQLLGVHYSTVYRWEYVGSESVKIEPMQAKLITTMTLIANVGRSPELRQAAFEDVKVLGPQIAAQLKTRGSLAGLYTLLRHVFDDKRGLFKHALG